MTQSLAWMSVPGITTESPKIAIKNNDTITRALPIFFSIILKSVNIIHYARLILTENPR